MEPLDRAAAEALLDAVVSRDDAATSAERLGEAMQRVGLLEVPAPPAALQWIATFVAAYAAEPISVRAALALVAELRAEATLVPALELERLRNRNVLFYLDSVSQYVDAQPELRDLPLANDIPAIADEFGIAPEDAVAALRMTLTGKTEGPPLELIFPLLGHDRIMMRIGAVNSHVLHGRGLRPIEFGPDGQPFRTIEGRKPT